jgi:hypothetical protein
MRRSDSEYDGSEGPDPYIADQEQFFKEVPNQILKPFLTQTGSVINGSALYLPVIMR